MTWFFDQLRHHVELALFLSLALGYLIGPIRIGRMQLGPVLGTLLAGLVVGQVGIAVPDAMRTVFFLMFLFAVGYRMGPEFIRGLGGSALSHVALTTILCCTGLGLTWTLACLAGLDAGTAAGMMAGALTSSAAVGTASEAVRSLGLAPEVAAKLRRP